MPAVFIKQKLEVLEAMTGCETENTYKVFEADVNGKKKGSAIFKIKEDSECCERICCPGACRPYKLKFKGTGKMDDVVDTFLKCEREFACTCMCCGRPSIKVYNTEKDKNSPIGEILSNFDCCNMSFTVFDHKQEKKFDIKGDICQMGYLCRGFPCEACQECKFQIYDESKQLIDDARMYKKSAGCFKACVGDVDNYSVIFPRKANGYERALLIVAAIFTDYQFFEENSMMDDQGGQTHY